MWEPIWASRFRYWLLTGDVSRSCLHCSRTRRVRTLKVTMTVILWVYVIWCTEGCSESRIWSRTWRGVSKWSRHKDWYIVRLYSDTGSVPEKFRIKPEHRGLPEPPGGLMGLMGLKWRRGGAARAGRAPPLLSPFLPPLLIGQGKGGESYSR